MIRKTILTAILLLLIPLLSSCALQPVSDADLFELRLYNSDLPKKEEVIKAIKDRMVYFEKDGECFVAVFYRSWGFTSFTLTKVDCKK